MEEGRYIDMGDLLQLSGCSSADASSAPGILQGIVSPRNG